MAKIQLFGEEKPTELKHICLTDSRYPIRHYVAAAGERLNCQSDEPLNKMQVKPGTKKGEFPLSYLKQRVRDSG